MGPQTSLGQIVGSGFDQDLALGDRYIAFSAELLRLALLAIGAIGYVLKSHLSGQAKHEWLLATAILMGLCAAFALAHRYIASDMLACQLRLTRLRTRNLERDLEPMQKEIAARKWRMAAAGPLLMLAAISLFAGALTFVAAL